MLSAGERMPGTTDVTKLAGQLGEVRLLPVAHEGHLMLEATVKFGVQHFEAGEFVVWVGLKEALLRLSHPAFDASEPYQANVKPEVFHESFVKKTDVEASVNAEAGFGGKVFSLLGFKIGGKADAERKSSIEVSSKAEYSIVLAEPRNTWRIGSQLGDPRHPAKAYAKGVEHCLHGAYVAGSEGETGHGVESRKGKLALCRLDPKPIPQGANDQRITATLFGAADSLQVALDRKTRPSTAAKRAEAADREKELREAIIQICVERGARVEEARAGVDEGLTGEYFLSSDTKMAAMKIAAGVLKAPTNRPAPPPFSPIMARHRRWLPPKIGKADSVTPGRSVAARSA